jgi:predicted kinase
VNRRVVVVSGSPAAGKTTLSRPLAAALDLPLLGKDVIKERLYDSLGPLDSDAVVSGRRFGGIAMELLWRIAAECPAVVLETNFLADDRERILALSTSPVEVHCACPPEVALARYAERTTRPDLHPVHRGRTLSVTDLEQYRGPIGAGAVITVDTTAPADIDALATQVRRAWDRG